MSFQGFQDTTQLPNGAKNLGAAEELRKKNRQVEQMQSWLTSRLAELMGVDAEEIDVREPFASFGLNSIEAVSLSGDLEDLLHCQLPATLLWDYPTIEVLSRHLVEEVGISEEI